jgi:hypothetical protein
MRKRLVLSQMRAQNLNHLLKPSGKLSSSVSDPHSLYADPDPMDEEEISLVPDESTEPEPSAKNIR